MILWCSITALLGGIVTLIIYFLPYNGGFYAFSIINSIYLNSFILIAILVFIVAIFTNPAWRRKFISQMAEHSIPPGVEPSTI
uniref:Uncharacterized protein n=1 Tax=Acrobeloides nanus TaxID=290746 RepID=A0A914DCA9_9BILA